MSPEKEETLYERTMRRLKNNPIVVAVLVIGAIAIAALQGLDVFSKLQDKLSPPHAQIREVNISVQPYDVTSGYTGSPILLTPTLQNPSDVNAIAEQVAAQIVKLVQPSQSGDYSFTLTIDGDLLRSDKPLQASLIMVSESNPAVQQGQYVELGPAFELSGGLNLKDIFKDRAYFASDCNCVHFTGISAPSTGYSAEVGDVYKLPGGYSFEADTPVTTRTIHPAPTAVMLLVERPQGQGPSEAEVEAAQTSLDNALQRFLQGSEGIALSPYRTLDELEKEVRSQIPTIPVGAGKGVWLSEPQHRVDFVVTVAFVMK